MDGSPDLGDNFNVHQLIRFNEGIDQALTESTVRFMQETNSARDLAIAVMAHDLRNPLNASFLRRRYFKEPVSIRSLSKTLPLIWFIVACV